MIYWEEGRNDNVQSATIKIMFWLDNENILSSLSVEINNNKPASSVGGY